MTPEEFERVIAGGDPMRVARACESLDESQRRELSKTALDIDKEVRRRGLAFEKKVPDTPLWTRLKTQCKPKDKSRLSRILEHVIELAILAVCPFSSARKAYGGCNDEDFDAAFVKVLVDRRPEWIDQWITEKLEAEFTELSWAVLRGLIRSGACAKPTTDGYVRFMAEEMDSWVSRNEDTPLSRRLLDEPDLLEDVWRLFDVETDALASYSSRNQFAPKDDEEGWGAALIKLSDSGNLNRGRLLNSCLSALDNDFKNSTLTGYIRLFEKLAPTDDDLTARQQAFLSLLASRVSHIITFSLKMLKRIEKAKWLDGEAFIAAVPPVFALNAKGQSKTALEIMAQTTKRDANMVPWALGAAIEALTHETAEVQQKAIDLIESWSERAHPDHATAFAERLDDLAPSLRHRVQAVIARVTGEPVRTDAGVERPDESEPAIDDLFADAERIDLHWRSLAGVDVAIEAIRDDRMPAPLDFDLLDVPLLSATEPVQPIETVDELIDAVAHAIEEVDSADELERILDGISRLNDRRPEDFERRTEPLAKRLLGSAGFGSGGRGIGVPEPYGRELSVLLWVWFGKAPTQSIDFENRRLLWSQLVALLRGWRQDMLSRAPELDQMLRHMLDASRPQGAQQFVANRVRELIERVRNRESAPLLAAPTHDHGWIDPRTLVERVAEFERKGIDVRPCDFVQALLRLAPDRRRDALSEAADLRGNVGRILRWALRSDAGPSERDWREASLWLAAGRARAPRGRLDELGAVGFEEDIPDAIVPATYSWEARDDVCPWIDASEAVPRVVVGIEPNLGERRLPPLVVTPMLHGERQSRLITGTGGIVPWGIQWTASIWPLCVDPLLAESFKPLMTRLDMAASTLEPNHEYFDPLFEVDRPWSELAHVAVWIGLLTRDADTHTVALDAVIEAIANGRVHPEPLSCVLLRLMAGEWVKLNRVAEALREVARVSPLHAWTAVGVLDALAGSFEKPPRDAHHVLSLLLELWTELGLAPAAQCRTTLESIKGSGKSAKAAKALLALESQPQAPAMCAAGRQLLTARIARAKRWQAAS